LVFDSPRLPNSCPIPQVVPYTPAAAFALFKVYSDPEELDDPVVSPEGLERICTDADLPMEGALPVILAWQLEAEEMGKITQAQWEKGMSTLRCGFSTLWKGTVVMTVDGDDDQGVPLSLPSPRRCAPSKAHCFTASLRNQK
jgi:hypothetical protein